MSPSIPFQTTRIESMGGVLIMYCTSFIPPRPHLDFRLSSRAGSVQDRLLRTSARRGPGGTSSYKCGLRFTASFAVVPKSPGSARTTLAWGRMASFL